LVCACAQTVVSRPASIAAIAIFFVIILTIDLQIWATRERSCSLGQKSCAARSRAVRAGPDTGTSAGPRHLVRRSASQCFLIQDITSGHIRSARDRPGGLNQWLLRAR